MLPIYAAVAQQIENEEINNEIQNLNIERRIRRSNSDSFSFSNIEFVNLYRLTKDMVRYLCDQLIPHMSQSGKENAISPLLRIFTALFFFANGSYQRVLGHSYALSMGQTTVSKCVEELTRLILTHLGEQWISFPETDVEQARVKADFMIKHQFPGVIGAIDCTHVSILAPTNEEHNYLNRKGYDSKNVQLICDSNLRILNVSAQFAGATHDSYIWRQSGVNTLLRGQFEDGNHSSWLLGDAGYPQQPWLMTPVANAEIGSPQERYNQRHCSARNCIERVNGILKNRFRCISGERKLRYTPEKVGRIIISCVVLHNICVDGRMDNEVVLNPLDNEEVNNNIHNEDNRGRDARNNLIERYFN